MRDRLIELVMECSTFTPEFEDLVRSHAEYVANHLINNGVIIRDRGEWNIVCDIEKFFMCTACNSRLKIFAKFCPECGADMRGENGR